MNKSDKLNELNNQLLEFRAKFLKRDLRNLRAFICGGEADVYKSAPSIAQGRSKTEQIALLESAESQLEKIAEGYIDIGEFEEARSIIAEYELNTDLSARIYELEHRRKPEHVYDDISEEKKQIERNHGEFWSANEDTGSSAEMDSDTAEHVDWHAIMYNARRVARIAIPIAAAVIIASFIYANWRRLFPLAVISVIVYRVFIRRFFRF